MRIKFKKGMTPERIAEAFARFIRENDIVVGSVNIYIQTLDENTGKYCNDEECLICCPGEESKREYTEYMASARRRKFKEVV